MIAMPNPPARFTMTLACVWAVMIAAGVAYSRFQDIPARVALAVLPVLLVEAACYLVPAFGEPLGRLQTFGSRSARASLLAASAVIPYLYYAALTGTFRWSSLAWMAAIAAAGAFWFHLLPRSPAADIGFLALIAGVSLSRVFAEVYGAPAPGLKMDILGEFMWRRVGILAVFLLRPVEGTGFGFLPRRREWAVGLREYLYFAPAGLGLALAIGFIRFDPAGGPWWRLALVAAGTFLGMLWFVALTEEFFFRGLLQQWLSGWLRSSMAGMILASVLFGLVHLPFRAPPLNWRFALLAAAAGFFYGRAFRAGRGIRAAMVTHALVNTSWRVFFV